MTIIRDEELGGIMMIPLWSQYNLHRCNVRDCTNKQTTIVTGLIEQPFALCETHYQEAKTNGEIKCTLDFLPCARWRQIQIMPSLNELQSTEL